MPAKFLVNSALGFQRELLVFTSPMSRILTKSPHRWSLINHHGDGFSPPQGDRRWPVGRRAPPWLPHHPRPRRVPRCWLCAGSAALPEAWPGSETSG